MEAASERFPTTDWSVIVEASGPAHLHAIKAMNHLCSRYRRPIMTFVRAQCGSHHDAEDLTQSFFEFAIRQSVIQRARRERGRFRSFILASLRNFLCNQHDMRSTEKRGGKFRFVPLDEMSGASMSSTGGGICGQDSSFDREWALTILRRSLEIMEEKWITAGKAEKFRVCSVYIARRATVVDYARIASELGISAEAAEMSLARMRREFGETLRREVSKTVAHPDDIEDEIRYLRCIVAEDL